MSLTSKIESKNGSGSTTTGSGGGQRSTRAGNASWDTVVSCCRDVGREGGEGNEGKRRAASGWSADLV